MSKPDLGQDLANALTGLVQSLNSTRQLINEWPDGEKYIPADSAGRVPAVRGAAISQKIREYAADN